MRRNGRIRVAACGAVLTGAAALLYGYPFGPGPGFAGAPGDATCAQCHGGGKVNTGGGSIRLSLSSYAPGVNQHVVVTVKDASASRWGFEATPRVDKDNSEAGSIKASDANTQVVSSGQLEYVEHTLAGTRAGTTGSITFEFDWTPPATNAGDVVFYVAANAANGNNQADSGDHIYTASFRLPAAVQQSGPSIKQNGIVNGASFVPGMAPGAWLSIFGANLAPSARNWRDDEIVNGKFPTSLDGVSVTIDNKPAAVNYIGPTQINVQVPDDDSAGPVDVKITTPQGTVEGTAVLQKFAPAFFMYDADNRKYIAAQHPDFSPVGHTGLIPNANATPAKPGEVIVLYGTGFGPTDPPTRSGEIIHSASQLEERASLAVQIGGVPAEVQFAGMTIAGVCQINVKVPAGLPDGDAPVAAQIQGARSQDNAFITVQH